MSDITNQTMMEKAGVPKRAWSSSLDPVQREIVKDDYGDEGVGLLFWTAERVDDPMIELSRSDARNLFFTFAKETVLWNQGRTKVANVQVAGRECRYRREASSDEESFVYDYYKHLFIPDFYREDMEIDPIERSALASYIQERQDYGLHTHLYCEMRSEMAGAEKVYGTFFMDNLREFSLEVAIKLL